METPQQRSLTYLRNHGFLAASVERRKRFPDKHRSVCRVCGQTPMIEFTSDLWNFADLLAVSPSAGTTVLIQVTTNANAAARLKKILDEPEINLSALTWILAGNLILIHAWAKMGARGERKTWQLTVREITEEMLRKRAA